MNHVADHRRIGRELKIFATEEQCGSGLPFWLPAGATICRELETFIIDLEQRNGYRHVSTPVMAKRELYERSGHWEHFHDEMYPPMGVGSEELVLRPMLCPHHILLYDRQPRTWRALPLRLAEVGSMFRYERSGVVGGLSRVRQMTLNDGHVFCPPEHVAGEIEAILAMVHTAYRALHIPAPRLRLSRGGEEAKYTSDPALWRRSEAMLRQALGARVRAAQQRKIPYLAVVGQREEQSQTVSVRLRDGRQLPPFTVEECTHELRRPIEARSL